MSREFDPEVVASSFIKQFYEKLSKNPSELHRFYKEESHFTHCDGQQQAQSYYGADNIRKRVSELNLAGSKVDISEGSLDAHRSENNGVIVVATGLFTPSDSDVSSPFVQTFFLSSQSNSTAASYFLKNSVFRIIGPSLLSASKWPNVKVVDSASHVKSSEVTTSITEGTKEVMTAPVSLSSSPDRDHLENQPISNSLESHPDALVSSSLTTYEDAVEGEVEAAESKDVLTESTAGLPEVDIPLSSESELVASSVGSIEDLVPESVGQAPIIDVTTPSPQVPTPVTLAPKETITARKPKSWLDAVKKLADDGLAASATSAPGVSHSKTSSSKMSKAPVSHAPEKQTRPTSQASNNAVNSAGSATSPQAPAGPTSTVRGPPRSEEHRLKHSVYIRNVHESTTERDLRNAFIVFGTVVQVDVKASKGFAFVEFDTVDAVSKVLALTEPVPVKGNNLSIQERNVNPGGGQGNTPKQYVKRTRPNGGNGGRAFRDDKVSGNGHKYTGSTTASVERETDDSYESGGGALDKARAK